MLFISLYLPSLAAKKSASEWQLLTFNDKSDTVKVDPWCTWSFLLVCRRRCRRKWKREHLRTRMRSVFPSARWAEGERPLGLRGHAQLMQAALMARNFPWITLQLSSSAGVSTTKEDTLASNDSSGWLEKMTFSLNAGK